MARKGRKGEEREGKKRKKEEGKEDEAWIVSFCTIQTQLSQAQPTPSILSQAMSPDLAKPSHEPKLSQAKLG